MTAPHQGSRDTFIEQTRWIPVRGQVDLDATTATTVYTVPKNYYARVRVFFAERGGAAATVRLALRIDDDADGTAESLANKHYLVYDAPLAANEDMHTEELWLGTDDVITAYASTGNVSVNVNGRRWPKQ